MLIYIQPKGTLSKLSQQKEISQNGSTLSDVICLFWKHTTHRFVLVKSSPLVGQIQYAELQFDLLLKTIKVYIVNMRTTVSEVWSLYGQK